MSRTLVILIVLIAIGTILTVYLLSIRSKTQEETRVRVEKPREVSLESLQVDVRKVSRSPRKVQVSRTGKTSLFDLEKTKPSIEPLQDGKREIPKVVPETEEGGSNVLLW